MKIVILSLLGFIVFWAARLFELGVVPAMFCAFVVVLVAQSIRMFDSLTLRRAIGYSLWSLTIWMVATYIVFVRPNTVNQSDEMMARIIAFMFWVVFGCVNAAVVALDKRTKPPN